MNAEDLVAIAEIAMLHVNAPTTFARIFNIVIVMQLQQQEQKQQLKFN